MPLSLARAPRRMSVPVWAAVAVGVWLAAVIAYALVGGPDAPPLCALRRTTGVPCPTCGTTRAGLALLSGRPLRAVAFNPFVCAAAAAGAAWLVLRVGFGRTLRIDLPGWRRGAMWGVLAVLFAANWAYVIWRELG